MHEKEILPNFEVTIILNVVILCMLKRKRKKNAKNFNELK